MDSCIRRRFSLLPSFVKVAESAKSDVACGGILIGNHVVLTAAQCLFLSRKTRNPVLVFDALNAREHNSVPEKRRTLRAIRHPKFNGNVARGHDIALLRFRGATSLKRTLIALKRPRVGTRLVIIGYAGNTVNVRRAVVASAQECESVGVTIHRKSMTCIFGEVPCKGDEGGPILNEVTGELVGVVSATSFCQREQDYMGIILLNYRGVNEWTRSILYNLESPGFKDRNPTELMEIDIEQECTMESGLAPELAPGPVI